MSDSSARRKANAPISKGTRMIVTRNLRYRPGSDRGLLDLYHPEGNGPFPVVLCLHGGGWRQGDKAECAFLASHLTDAGIAAVAANYRLTTTATHPAQVEDVFEALDWIVAHGPERRLDPQRIGLTGWSAGGHLTMLAGVKAFRRRAGWNVRAILPLCGVSDVALWARQNPECRHFVLPFLDGTPEERPETARDSSPLLHVHRHAPPCLAFHGGDDPVVHPDQSVLFAEALRRVGVEAEAVVLPGVAHTGAMPGTSPCEPLGGSAPFRRFFTRHLSTEVPDTSNARRAGGRQ